MILWPWDVCVIPNYVSATALGFVNSSINNVNRNGRSAGKNAAGFVITSLWKRTGGVDNVLLILTRPPDKLVINEKTCRFSKNMEVLDGKCLFSLSVQAYALYPQAHGTAATEIILFFHIG